MNILPPSLTAADLLGLFFGVSEILLGRIRRTTDRSKDDGSLRLLWYTIGFSLAVGIAVAHTVPMTRIHSAFIHRIGLGCFFFGLVLRWWSILCLGRFFTVNVAIADDHRVVDSGPYRFIRHPSYTGALVAFLGLGLTFRNLLTVLIIVIPTFLAFQHRIRVEERVLTEALPDYRDYARRTKRLIPFLY